jgi:large repetitive protein
MINKLFKIPTFLVFLMLMYQLVFPIGNVLVSANTMLPPSNLTYQAVTPDDGKLIWSTVFGASGYKIYEINDGQLIVLGTTASSSYSLNNLAEGSYRYVVSTINSDGESGPSAPVSVEIVYPNMAAPANLSSTIKNGNDVVLSWDASQYAEKYNVYEINENGDKTLVTATTSKTYSLVKSPEGTYTYAVSAENALYGESPISTPIKVEVVYPVMKQPSNLSFSIANGSDVTLKWQAADFATNYKVYQITDGQQVLKGTVTGTSVKFTNLTPGDYEYKVYSYSDRFGESAEGSQVSLTVSSIVMEAPSNPAYKIQNINDAVISWGTVPFATGYKVYQVVDGERVLKSTVTGTSVTYTMLPAGNHEYEIFSFSDRFGESESGSKLAFNIDAVTMYPPAELSYKIQNGNDIVLNWVASENANNYKVYQMIDGQKVLKSTATGTSVTFSNMPSGDYQFEVHANSTRFGESKEAAKVNFSLEPVLLNAPENASYEVKNGNDVVLKWDSVEYATNYKVYQLIDGKKVLKTSTSGLSATYTNLIEGDYQYEIHAYSTRFGESEKGANVQASIVYPEMKAPVNIVGTIKSPSSFTLGWDSVDYATSYKVYQIIDGQKVLLNNVSGTTVTYSDKKPGTYQYEVYSFSTRFGESKQGTPVEVVLNGQVLEAPGNLTTTIKNGNDLTLKWDSVQYATSYNIYQNVDGLLVFKRAVTSTTSTFTNMPEGEYNFLIKANSNLFGESPEGTVASGSIDYPEMAKPENVTYSIINGNDITLKWNAVTYATSYKIYQIVGGKAVLQRTVTGTSTTFVNMPEGDYLYEIHSYSDRFGESSDGSKLEHTLVYPIMQAPSNLTKSIVNGNDIVLKWNASTFAKEYRIYQVVDGEKVLQRTVTGTSTTFVNMPEGEYLYEIHSYSDRFGESADSSVIEHTLVYPIMQAPANFTKTIANGNDISLKWNASTYATAYKIYQIIDGKKVLERTVTTTSTTFINMPEGDYDFIVHSYSARFGESPEGSDLAFNLKWPVVQVPSITGTVFNANNITLSWPAGTWANEYRVYKVVGNDRELVYKGTARSYNVYNLTEETHSFEVTAYSTRFGESQPSNLVTEAIVYPEMEAPKATLKLLSETSARITWDFVTYANGYNIYEIIDGKPVLLVEKLNNLSYTLQNLTYANHEYYVKSYSNSFGESQPSETVLAKLIIDTTAPETNINAPTDWVNQNQSLTLEAADDETGVAKTFYSLNDGIINEGTSVLVDQEGIHKISYHSVDKVGNAEQVKTAFVKIDKTAPTTGINDIPAYAQSFTVELTGKDELSGIAKTYYSINDSEFVKGTSFTVDKEGINEISYYSIDEAGNKEEIKTATVTIDKTAPITSTQVPETWVNHDVSVSLTAKDENSGVAKTYYSVNGSDYQEGTSFVIESEGINEVTYYSVDTAGNREAVNTKQVKIDKTAPVVAPSVKEEYELGSTFTLDYTAQDGLSGIAAEEATLNGKSYKKGDTIPLDQPGNYTLVIKATDAAGLTTTVENSFVVYIPVTLEVLPKVIKENKGTFTVKATLPANYRDDSFDAFRVTLNGVSPDLNNKGLEKQAAKGQFKFEREDFDWTTGEQELELRGYINGKYLVVGKTTVEVKGNEKKDSCWSLFSLLQLVKQLIGG